ncbi:MAG TPA: hypothetical protein VM888_12775 [Chitinophagaceae bacterium]|nr:hypothetical protein [Chitinophagaceae bacterium]
MKKFIFLVLLSIGMLQAMSQNSYLKFKVFYPLAGTPRELISGMKDAGLDKSATVGFTVNYPRMSRYPSLVLEWGTFLRGTKSISILGGLQEGGWVKGYNGMQGLRIDYTNWILNPKLNFHNSEAMWGVGPSALLVQYKKYKRDFGKKYNQSKIVPGISLSAETVSKKQRGFRMGVFASLNLHPTFDIEPVRVEAYNTYFDFNSKLNPSTLNIGLRFQF